MYRYWQSTMARLLPLLIIIWFAIWLLTQIFGAPRGGPTYRPRPRWPDWFGDAVPADSNGTVHLARRSELVGVRDAYSSAPVNPGEDLVRCGKCLSFYHADSALVLKRENGGRCMVCGSADLGPVRLVD